MAILHRTLCWIVQIVFDSSSYSKKQIKLYAISFHSYLSHFVDLSYLFRESLHAICSQTSYSARWILPKYYLYSLEYAEKYTQRVSHNLHASVQVISKAVRWCSIGNVFVFIKFTRTWEIEVVSLNKIHKIPENSSHFRDAFRTQSIIYDGVICENS